MAVDPNDPRFWAIWGDKGQPALPGDAEWFDPQQPAYAGIGWGEPGHSRMDQGTYAGLGNPAADDTGFYYDQTNYGVPMPQSPVPFMPVVPPDYVKANDYYSQPQPEQIGVMGSAEDFENAPYDDGYPQAYDAPFGFNTPLLPAPINPYRPIAPWRSRRSAPPPGQGDVPPEPDMPWRR